MHHMQIDRLIDIHVCLILLWQATRFPSARPLMSTETTLKDCLSWTPLSALVFILTLILRKSRYRNHVEGLHLPLVDTQRALVFTLTLIMCKSWYRNYIEGLPIVDTPECFGFHPLADITQGTETIYICETMRGKIMWVFIYTHKRNVYHCVMSSIVCVEWGKTSALIGIQNHTESDYGLY